MNSEPKVIIDLPPTHAGPYPSISPSSIDVGASSWRPPPRKNGLPIVLAVMGACGTLAALAGVIGVHRYRERQKEDAKYSQQIADSQRRAAQSTETVAPAPIDPAPIATADPVPTVKIAPPPVVKTQPNPAPVVVKSSPKPIGQTGLVRTYSTAAGKAIFIDGKQAGVAPAPLTVQCGPHSVRVGEGKPRNVSVPCGGNITVGTPDGD